MAKTSAERRRDISTRRKESGLTTKKIHLSEYSLDGLSFLATELGFDYKVLNQEENLSLLVEYCITNAYDMHFNEEDDFANDPPSSKFALQLWKYHLIVKHLKSNGKDNASIVDFMNSWAHCTPPAIARQGSAIDDYDTVVYCPVEWTRNLVTKLSDKKRVDDYISRLNLIRSVL